MYQLVVVALTQLLACEPAHTSVAPSDAPQGSADEVTASSAGASNDGDVESTPAWCAVERVVRDKCQRCHGAPPAHGAPFSLVTYADTQVIDRRGQARFLAMQQAVESGAMPATFIELEPPTEPLTNDEQQLLLHWCAAGAPPPDSELPCPER